MPHATHHVFFSYSRADNRHPVDERGRGWVTAFRDRLVAQHRAYSGRDLKIFFDQEEIVHGTDWRARLGQGLRTSNLFLAFLSENYIRSENCRWEWIEYLRREHTLARGDDGIATIYFVTVPPMPGADTDDPEAMAALEEEFRADEAIRRWLDEIREDLQRRQLYVDSQATGRHPKAAFDLRWWFPKGPTILTELDAAERLEELRQNPQSDEHGLVTLADRLEELDKHIATRLDRCLLADLAPGNLGASYPHFVGRHRELRKLHETLVTDRRGLVTAAHGLGGQGKTALAIQYAFAYAEFYAAGGRWIVGAEGKKTMAACLVDLASEPALKLTIPENLQGDDKRAAGWVLEQLEAKTLKRSETLRDHLWENADRQSGEKDRLPSLVPRCLIVLDNVDQPELLSAEQVALLPMEEWLEVVVTTRLDPKAFGGATGGQRIKPIEVDSLPTPDALALLQSFRAFKTPDEEKEAKALVEALGGYTLVVEVVGAYLGAYPEVAPGAFVERLKKEGLLDVDRLTSDAQVKDAVRHREKQLGIILDATLERVEANPAARTLLDCAAFMAPDHVVTDWLWSAAATSHPELAQEPEPGYRNERMEAWRLLEGLRLLTPALDEDADASSVARRRDSIPPLVRIHRMTAAHLRSRMDASRCEVVSEIVAKCIFQRAGEFEHFSPRDADGDYS